MIWWMDLNLVSEGQCFVQQCVWGVSGLGVAFGSLSANGQGYVPVLLKGKGMRHGMRHLALKLTGFWVGPGLSVEIKAFGRILAK